MAELKNMKETYDGCVELLTYIVGRFNEYLKSRGITSEDDFQPYKLVISSEDIITTLFLKGEGQDLEINRHYLRRLLDVSKDDVIDFGFTGGEDGDSEE